MADTYYFEDQIVFTTSGGVLPTSVTAFIYVYVPSFSLVETSILFQPFMGTLVGSSLKISSGATLSSSSSSIPALYDITLRYNASSIQLRKKKDSSGKYYFEALNNVNMSFGIDNPVYLNASISNVSKVNASTFFSASNAYKEIYFDNLNYIDMNLMKMRTIGSIRDLPAIPSDYQDIFCGYKTIDGNNYIRTTGTTIGVSGSSFQRIVPIDSILTFGQTYDLIVPKV